MRMVAQAYEAALEPKEWVPFVEQLEEALGGAAVALHLDYVVPPEPDHVIAPSYDPEHFDRYFAYYAVNENPYRPHIPTVAAGEVAWNFDYVTPDELRASGLYAD